MGVNGGNLADPESPNIYYWHHKHTYLSSLGYNSTQLNSFADHIIFNNGYMKHAHTKQRMTNNNSSKRKQV